MPRMAVANRGSLTDRSIWLVRVPTRAVAAVGSTDATTSRNVAVNAEGSPAGPALTMPGSQVMQGGGALSKTPIVARAANGGFHVAYALGYPTANQVRVWRVGASTRCGGAPRSGTRCGGGGQVQREVQRSAGGCEAQ